MMIYGETHKIIIIRPKSENIGAGHDNLVFE